MKIDISKKDINDLSLPYRIKRDMMEFVTLYLDGKTDSELSKKYKVSERTIRSWLKELRDNKIIPYRSELDKTDKSKKIVKDRFNKMIENEPANTANVSKAELIKLLNIHKSRTAVAKELGVPISEVSDLVEYYHILDNKTLATKLNIILKDLLKDIEVEVPKVKFTSSGATIALLLSDWHVGKVVKDENGTIIYDTNVFKRRLNILIKQILKLIDRHLKSHLNIEEFVILAVGDFANGDGIYPTQAYEQEEAPPEQVMIAVNAFIKIINSVMDRGLPVKFFGVYGNHGRQAKDTNPEANWDLMIYRILHFWKNITNPKDLFINYSEREYLDAPIRKWIFHLRHKAYYQDETAAGDSKFKGWKDLHNADVIVSGHYHHWDVNERKIMGGSLCGQDNLSERMATSTGEPAQVIWVVTDKYSHTNIFPIRVEQNDKEE